VLNRFEAAEQDTVTLICNRAADVAENIITLGWDQTVSRMNVCGDSRIP
jgi:peptidyl-tRNA hydrolase